MKKRIMVLITLFVFIIGLSTNYSSSTSLAKSKKVNYIFFANDVKTFKKTGSSLKIVTRSTEYWTETSEQGKKSKTFKVSKKCKWIKDGKKSSFKTMKKYVKGNKKLLPDADCYFVLTVKNGKLIKVQLDVNAYSLKAS